MMIYFIVRFFFYPLQKGSLDWVSRDSRKVSLSVFFEERMKMGLEYRSNETDTHTRTQKHSELVFWTWLE